MSYPSCRHCGIFPGSYGHILCYACYRKKHIRDLYPTRPPVHKGTMYNASPQSECLEPTDAMPGTEDKIKVLTERLELGQRLWHPQDACRCPDD